MFEWSILFAVAYLTLWGFGSFHYFKRHVTSLKAEVEELKLTVARLSEQAHR
jgi:hypothetical protein